MRLIGTVSEHPNDKGMYLLNVRGLPIPLHRVLSEFAGARVCVRGDPRYTKELGSYFHVADCIPSDAPSDKNDVTIRGTVTHIFPERENARGRRSACIIVQHGSHESSTALVTALSSKVDELGVGNLSVGDRVSLSGYLSYSGKGCHIIYQRTVER